MKHYRLPLLIFLSLSLCACEEKVSIRTYENLQRSMYLAEEKYEETLDRYRSLKEDQDELESKIRELNNEYEELKKRVVHAKEKVKILIDEYNKMINGHWALREKDIANDASDVQSALEGNLLIYRIRTRNGIRY